MIKLKNASEILVPLIFDGNATSAATRSFLVPFPCQIKALYSRCRVAGVTGAQTVDVQKNGTTIFTSGLISFASGATVPTYGTVPATPTQLVKGDYITLVLGTQQTTQAKDVTVEIVVQRVKGSGPVATTVTDTVGLEAE